MEEMEAMKEGLKPIKIYNSKIEFIFSKGKKNISYNKTSKIFKSLENVFPGSKEYNVYAVLGYIETKNRNYILCANQTTFVGKVLEARIFKIEKFCYVPEIENNIDPEDASYLKMFDDFLERNPLYYSDKLDLTISVLNLQKKLKTSPKSNIFKYTVSQYCWNYSMAKCFDSEGMNEFIYPVINGFFGIREVPEYDGSNNFHYILIGRKDDRRSGMRFLIRGADENGNVANTVETEELVTYKDNEGYFNICSFIQIRGSIPIIWKQEPNLQLNPKIKPEDDFTANCEVFKLHIEELFENYGKVCCVNLIDQKKDQKIIGEYYNSIVLNYKEGHKNKKDLLYFVWFDFHKECKGMKYENIKKLFKKQSFHDCLNEFDFNHIKFRKESLEDEYQENKMVDILISKKLVDIVRTQKGIFRNNCIDSLDRTNVVQSVIGRYYLFDILSNIGFSNNKPSEDDVFKTFQEPFETTFKLLWANHGDNISLAYSGTGALKSDFVRTGKRTLMGNIQDGYLSSKRFYLNNFRDGYNQDCHDYFLGALNPRKKEFKQHSPWALHVLISIFLFFTYFIFSVSKRISLPSNYEASLKKFVFKLLVFSCSLSLSYLLINKYAQKIFIDYHTRYDKRNI